MVRVSRPIRQRKAAHKRKEDPVVRNLTRAVGIICLGFLLILIGVLLTVFGVSSLTDEGVIASTIIVGPIILILGILMCIGGFVWYGMNYRLRMEREDYLPPQNGSDSLDSTLGLAGTSLRGSTPERGAYL